MPFCFENTYGFILGFQRLVWCPKCSPASNKVRSNSGCGVSAVVIAHPPVYTSRLGTTHTGRLARPAIRFGSARGWQNTRFSAYRTQGPTCAKNEYATNPDGEQAPISC